MARISRALQIQPRSFCDSVPAPPGPGAFRTGPDPTSGFARLILHRQAAPALSQACVFLVQLHTGRSRCALRALQPVDCQLFPLEVAADSLAGEGPLTWREGAGCWRRWPPEALDEPGRRALLETLRARHRTYQQVIARWHTHLDAAAAPPSAPLAAFLAHVLAAYAEARAPTPPPPGATRS